MKMFFYFLLLLFLFTCKRNGTNSSSNCVLLFEGVKYNCACREIDGEKEGITSCYNKNGILFLTRNYVNDILNGQEKAYYPNGNIKSEMMFENAMPVGVAKKFFPNGQINEYLYFFKGDSMASYHKVWDVEGNLVASKLPVTIEFNGQPTNKIEPVSFMDSFDVVLQLEYSEYDTCYAMVVINDVSNSITMNDTVFNNSTVLHYSNISKSIGEHHVKGTFYEILPPNLIGGVTPFEFQYVVK
ncbi:MAG: hypothetical protein KDD01_18825 [Phaeodactylibacter sp.]|nr:hypothetical protein [Phaeodactylibacter sp.]